MEKSKLGISIGLFGALLYFIGAMGSIGIFVVALATGYILFFETSEWLKKTAVKSLIIVVFLAIAVNLITYLSSSVTYILYFLRQLAINNDLFNPNYNMIEFFSLLQYLQMVINQLTPAVEILICVILGFRTYKQKDIKIKVLDDIINKHF